MKFFYIYVFIKVYPFPFLKTVQVSKKRCLVAISSKFTTNALTRGWTLFEVVGHFSKILDKTEKNLDTFGQKIVF